MAQNSETGAGPLIEPAVAGLHTFSTSESEIRLSSKEGEEISCEHQQLMD